MSVCVSIYICIFTFIDISIYIQYIIWHSIVEVRFDDFLLVPWGTTFISTAVVGSSLSGVGRHES